MVFRGLPQHREGELCVLHSVTRGPGVLPTRRGQAQIKVLPKKGAVSSRALNASIPALR